MRYSDWKQIQEETKVYVLTSDDGQERLLFLRDYRNTCIVRRQIKINGAWRYTQGLEGNELAALHGGICTTAEKGNKRYVEYLKRGYKKTVTTLDTI